MIMKFSVVLKFLFQSIICQVFFASMIISLGSHGNTTVLYIDDENLIAGPDLKENSHIGVKKLVYKKTPHGELILHIFNPKSAKKISDAPALVLFHGGGFKSGDPGQFYPQAKYLSQFGIVVISVQYRIKNTHGTERAHSVMDGKSALAWISDNAELLGIDRDKISVGGGSAGGFMAAVAPISMKTIANSDRDGNQVYESEPSIESIKPAAAVLYNPGFGVNLKSYKNFNEWKSESIFAGLDKNYPPTLILLGTDDWLTSESLAKLFCAQLREKKIRCDIVMYRDQKHGFFNSRRNLFDTTKRVENFLRDLNLISNDLGTHDLSEKL